MARTQARILVSIWSDPDFLQLPPSPQRLYLFLLSQPNLGHAGLLPLTVKRWSRKAIALSIDDIHNDLARLEADRFIVVDEATEEVLVRTLVRNDGVWKQPKVMPAMAANATEIESPRLQYALRQELVALDLTELKPESKVVIEPILTDLLETLCDTPPDTVPHTLPGTVPSERNSGVSDTPPDSPTRDARAASATASTSGPKPIAAKPPRERDEVWDSLLEACGVDPDQIPSSARGAYNRAVADLKGIGATPTEIRRRAAIFRGQWRDVSLTPTALARRWAECDRPPVTTPAPSRNGQILDAAMQRAQAAEARQQKAIGQ